MGRGDKKTKKGKIWKGSYGNSRKRAVNKAKHAPVATAGDDAGEKKPKAKKAPKKKTKVAEK